MGKINSLDYSNTKITGGLWKQKQDLLRKVTVKAVYDRFKDTGRIDAFKCQWKEGEPCKPHIFWDSDVAKWIEGVAYLTKMKREPALEKLCDKIINDIEKNQWEDGYINSYYTVIDSDKRFTNRDHHELYCAGHLMEAACAYYEATGKDKLLKLMSKYADCIEKHFITDKDTAFSTPGHEEIELALYKMYLTTKDEKYLNMCKFFINERGKNPEKLNDWAHHNYNQSHMPVREQSEAVGHAVRAVYLYCGMADLAYNDGDKELYDACVRLFDNIINKRMYITGGIGSSSCGEAFTVDYDLSNLLAYTESCAALGLALFANRMLKFGADSKYSDTIERIIYNGFLSSLSLDGKAFFYENPLEIIPYLHTRDQSNNNRGMHWPQMSRSEVFSCSCCPPNIVRFIPSIANMLYTYDENTVYVHQFMQSETKLMIGGKEVEIIQKTRYPENGKIKISIKGDLNRIAVRIPWWCENNKLPLEKGYAYFDISNKKEISLDFGMPIRYIEARTEAYFDCGKYAVMRGPIVYCMEEHDNGAYLRDIRLNKKCKFKLGKSKELGVPTLIGNAVRRKVDETKSLYYVKKDEFEKVTATLIPYYAFANRKPCEMQVWTFVK